MLPSTHRPWWKVESSDCLIRQVVVTLTKYCTACVISSRTALLAVLLLGIAYRKRKNIRNCPLYQTNRLEKCNV